MRSHLSSGRASISRPYSGPAVTGRYSVYPPVKDERLSRPEPTQVNDLPRVATEVSAIPGVSWLSRSSASLSPVGVNNLPTVATQWQLQQDLSPCLSTTSRTRYPHGHHAAQWMRFKQATVVGRLFTTLATSRSEIFDKSRVLVHRKVGLHAQISRNIRSSL